MVTIEERNYFESNTIVEFFGPNLEVQEFKIKDIYNDKNELVDAARHPRGIYKFKCDIMLEKYSMMRLKTIDIKTYL